MSEKKDFVYNHLAPLADKANPNRAVLADLRRGLREFPTISPHMYRHVQPYLPVYAQRGWPQYAHYLTSALFALHPHVLTVDEENEPDKRRKKWLNLGDHFAQIVREEKQANHDTESIERRFTHLLSAHPDDLHFHLRQAITFLSSKNSELKVNWSQLLRDIQDWNDVERRAKVQERWASQFWQAPKSNEESETTEIK
jgi:CRISPR type I-E-associated protein CasB/Cse2